MKTVTIFEEDFSSFSLGPLPFDPEHSAMGEYHYYPSPGYSGSWYDPIANYSYKGPSWIITKPHMDGKCVLEQMRVQPMDEKAALPTLCAGEKDWQDYTFSVTMRPLTRTFASGILFRYQTSMMHYAFFLVDKGVELHRVEKYERTVLGEAKVDWDCDTYQELSVEVKGERIRCFLQGKEVFDLTDSLYKEGGIALSSCMPAQYSHVKVSTDKESRMVWENKRTREKEETLQLRENLPQPVLWKKIDLGNFGAGRQIRFGHLKGGDELFFVICQHQRRVFKDRYPFISCMTAVSVETGEVLWQIGEPRDDKDVIQLTTDLPFQIYDIDGDGFDEVITSWDFTLKILDGRTGEVKKEIPTPRNSEDAEEICGIEFGIHATNRLNVDAIRIVNVSGNEKPSDILIKDRYARLWIYDCDLNLKWKFNHYNTGHFPYSFDINGDGKDEIFSCYNLIDSEGNRLWSLPIENDHTDEIIIGKLEGQDAEEIIAIVSGWEGFMMVDKKGTILHRDINGHGQRISVGNYCPERDGLEICTTTFWGNQGILYLHDCRGNKIWHKEALCNGNMITPVNWDGSGQDLILLNGNTKHGGLMDGAGRIVVSFPDDGHPDLCADVLDITGDNREEIVLWDRKSLYIYTQDKPLVEKDLLYCPEKYPMYNGSNYRGEYSFPNWKESPKNS